jgi:predicted esterase
MYETPFGGFGWSLNNESRWLNMIDLLPAIRGIQELLQEKPWLENMVSTKTGVEKYDFVGFSQGAALAFAYAALNPNQVRKLAGLSGFLPGDMGAYLGNHDWKEIDIFLAHGTRDTLVPIDKARFALDQLATSGARLSYCEDDVGHKLSTTCFKSLRSFFLQRC